MELAGKIINFLGDSITEGCGVADPANCRYDSRLYKECSLAAVNNYGIGGTRLAHQRIPSDSPRFDLCFCGRMWNMDTRADVIVVYGGVNDYFHGDAPIGTPEDRTPATFWGAVDYLMRQLPAAYPQAKIVFMTPARCAFEDVDETKPSPLPQKGADALALLDYVEIIKKKGQECGIPVLDLYHTLPLNLHDPAQKAAYTMDGLHFNDAGHVFLAKALGDFLRNL